MNFRLLLGLILCNLIWSANPAFSKIIMADFPPAHVAWFRYTSALCAYLVGMLVMRRPLLAKPRGRRDWTLFLALAFFTFCFSPLTQMTGLSLSRATDGALITAMEPLITALLAGLFLREKISGTQVSAFVVAFLGFGLLSGAGFGFPAGHIVGNVIILASLVGEGFYSIGGRKLLDRFEAAPLFGTALFIGVIFLSILGFFFDGFPDFARIGPKTILGIVWLGPLGTAAAYLYWMIAISRAPVVSIALTLFIQPVFGALWGYAFLGERLDAVQFFGAGLILLAVLGQYVIGLPKSRNQLS